VNGVELSQMMRTRCPDCGDRKSVVVGYLRLKVRMAFIVRILSVMLGLLSAMV
jgi:hypothetical protein